MRRLKEYVEFEKANGGATSPSDAAGGKTVSPAAGRPHLPPSDHALSNSYVSLQSRMCQGSQFDGTLAPWLAPNTRLLVVRFKLSLPRQAVSCAPTTVIAVQTPSKPDLPRPGQASQPGGPDVRARRGEPRRPQGSQRSRCGQRVHTRRNGGDATEGREGKGARHAQCESCHSPWCHGNRCRGMLLTTHLVTRAGRI